MVQLKEVAVSLAKCLADTYALQVKTQFFHWNCRGANFYEIHLLLDKQYEVLAEGVDLIAERIRGLGFIAPGSFSSFTKRTTVAETVNLPKTNVEMIADLLLGHETAIVSLMELARLAADLDDFGTQDLIGNQLFERQRLVWMLTSTNKLEPEAVD